jgi:hypothetical protein
MRSRQRRRAYNCRYLSYEIPPTRPGDEPKHLKLPLIKIEVASETESIGTVALIDSGSTSSFLPREIALDILRLPITHRDLPVEGAGGKFLCDIVKVKEITLIKGVIPIHTYSDWFTYIPKEPIELPYAVLGRDTIFRNFEITFRENEHRFVLK